MRLYLSVGACALLATLSWLTLHQRPLNAAKPVLSLLQLSSGAEMQAAMVGHEFRQDDLPAIAAAPDGGLWLAWLSFVGDRDDVVIRHYKDKQWGNLQWVPNTS